MLEAALLLQVYKSDAAKAVYEANVEEASNDQNLLLARAVLAKNYGDQPYFESKLKKLLADGPERSTSPAALSVFLVELGCYHQAR